MAPIALPARVALALALALVEARVTLAAYPAVSSSPVLHWTFDGPNATSRLWDSSGNGLGATIAAYAANVTWAQGLVGSHALQLSPQWKSTLGESKQGGTCPYLASPVLKSLGIRGMGPFALSLWLRPTLPVSSTGGLGSWAAFLGLYSTAIVGAVVTLEPRQRVQSGIYTNILAYPSFRTVSGEWMHVAVSYGGVLSSDYSVYINGELADSFSVAANLNLIAQLYIGWDPTTAQLCYSGLVDDVRLYNRPLSGDEVYALWSGPCDSPGRYVPAGARMPGTCEGFACEAGTTDDDGDVRTACVACSAGQYAGAGTQGPCAACGSHTTDADSDPATPCVACGPGHYVPGATGSSGPCSGYECGAGWTDADSDAGTACEQCGAGAYVPAGSAGACGLYQCAAGTVDDDGDAGTPCVEACTLAATPAACNSTAGCAWCWLRCWAAGPSCNPGCPAGTTAAGGSATAPCAACGAGAYAPAGSMATCAALVCAAGTTDDDGNASTACVACGAGHYAAAGSTGVCSVHVCGAGWVDNDSDASTACVQCGSGVYVPPGSQGPCSDYACGRGLVDADGDASTACVSACTLLTIPVVCYDSEYSSRPPSTVGLVLHWTFEQSSDGRLVDRSGFNMNGTLSNATEVLFPKGFMGSSLRLIPTYEVDEYTQATVQGSECPHVTSPPLDAVNISGSSVHTLAMWVLPSIPLSPDLTAAMAMLGPFADGTAYGVSWGIMSLQLVFAAKQSAVSLTGSFSVGWTHLATTYDGSTLKWYMNGNLKGSATAKSLSLGNGTVLTLGYDFTRTGLCFFGAYDDVRLYNRALAAVEVADLWRNFCPPVGLYMAAGSTSAYCSNYACATGTYDHDSNPATACIKCTAGQFTYRGYAQSCINCSRGTTDDDSDPSSKCVDCTGGTYFPPTTSLLVGPCSTYWCPAGTTDNDTDWATPCVPCSAGQYTPPGSYGPCSSFVCPAGFFDHDSDPSTACIAECLQISDSALCNASAVGCVWCGSYCGIQGKCGELLGGLPTSKGLAMLWTFEGSTVAERLQDRSGNGKLASIVQHAPNISWDTGRVGSSAIRFSPGWTWGSSGYFTQGSYCPGLVSPALDDVGITGTSAFTIAMWIKGILPSSWESMSLGYLGPSRANNVMFMYEASGTLSSGALYGSYVGTGMANSTWMHFTVSFDGATVFVYVDGRLVKKGTSAVNSQAKPVMTLAYTSYPWNLCFRGLVDDLRIYNRLLTADEVYGVFRWYCGPGHYVPVGNGTDCSAWECPAGTTDLDSDTSTACVQCSAGHYMPSASVGACHECPFGWTDDDSDASTPCVECGPGHYFTTIGVNGSCDLFACHVGMQDSDDDVATPCVSCGPAHYSPMGAHGACATTLCPAGTTDADSDAATPCVPCSAGHYVPQGSTGSCALYACAANATDDDSNSSTPCVACEPGHFLLPLSSGACDTHLCGKGTTDGDSNVATPCVPCDPGTGVGTEGASGPCSGYVCRAGWTDDDNTSATACVQCGNGTHTGAGSVGPCSSHTCAAGWTDSDWDASTACVQCGAGGYEAAGSAGPCASHACGTGSVDHDANASTPCVTECSHIVEGGTCNTSVLGCDWCGKYCAVRTQCQCDQVSDAAMCVLSYNCTWCAGLSQCYTGACPVSAAGKSKDTAAVIGGAVGGGGGACVQCGAGGYEAAGSAGPCASHACGTGSVDHDANASTPCVTECSHIVEGGTCNTSVLGCDWCGKYCAVRTQCQCDQVSDAAMCVLSYNCTWCAGLSQCYTGACPVSAAGKSKDTAAVIGGAVGGGGGGALFLAIVGSLLAVWVRRRQKLQYHDEVDASEILLGDVIGQGSFGVVHKALWRDTEVAAKVFSIEALQAQDIEQVAKEVDVMRALRHPNILLFMCHARSADSFIIVTEYMPTGSLMDLLGDEGAVVPLRLRLAIMSDIARGMAYLHQNDPPILHRDLKSSNILLDANRQAKVSDFGLTLFSHANARGGSRQDSAAVVGTIFWTAPEVLDGADCTTKSDVYSFGVIAWEIITREVPYAEENAHTVAMRVVKEGLRPSMEGKKFPPPIAELATECWSASPEQRPGFSVINSRLASMSSFLEDAIKHEEMSKVMAPTGSIALVFTDIQGSTSLWEWNPSVMKASLKLHNEIMRACFRAHKGFEVKTEGDAFMIAFQSPLDALMFCQEAQHMLLGAKWDPLLLNQQCCAEEFADGALSFRGVRVRMGIHFGDVDVEAAEGSSSGSAVDYFGPTVNKAARVAALAQGGQIYVSSAARTEIERMQSPEEAAKTAGMLSMRLVGPFKLKGIAEEEIIHEVVLVGLNRMFQTAEHSANSSSAASTADARPYSEAEVQDMLSKMTAQDKQRPTWAIDPSQVVISKTQIGRGNFGSVFKGEFKGETVAVKKFYQQKVDQATMIELQRQLKEISLLSSLRHPSIVLFMGASIDPNNMFIVTEWMDGGSLKSILEQKPVDMSRAVAIFSYIHASNIIHRDLKAANILVNDKWDVKITDFGLSAIKNANKTMTVCGTVAWMAPEILERGHFSEKSDVYAFGMVMYEVLTRHNPFNGVPVMSLVSRIISGGRPSIPDNHKGFSNAFVSLMQSTWAANPDDRPTFAQIGGSLSQMQ
eukprot:m51a1_g8957 putative serine threonine kinase (2606) ;mRNA; f:1042935-1051690